MASGIGATLREARNRRKIGLSEVEAALKIRVRHLRAIENEEWGELPGGAYTRGFIRTYANYLGLDGERLAEEHVEPAAPRDDRVPRVEADPIVASGSGRRRPLGWLAVGAACAVVVILIGVGLSGGGDEGHGGGPKPGAQSAVPSRPPKKVASTVGIRLAATGEVWVCLVDASGRQLVDGRVLPAGEEEGPFHSDSFTVSFGNGEVTMRIDGKEADIPESASPLGYEVSAGGGLSPLGETERPTCT